MNACLEGYSRRVEVRHFAVSLVSPATDLEGPANAARGVPEPEPVFFSPTGRTSAEPRADLSSNNRTARVLRVHSVQPGYKITTPGIHFSRLECHAFSSSLRQRLTRLMQGNCRPLHPCRQG